MQFVDCFAPLDGKHSPIVEVITRERRKEQTSSMAPAIRFSAMKSSTSHQEVLRPASASLVSKISDTSILFSNDSRKRKRRSFLTGDISIERARTFPSTGLSSSLDEESRTEEPLYESKTSSRLGSHVFATSVDKKLSASFPASLSHKQERSSMCIPEFKLKPRPKARNSAASNGSHTDLYGKSRLSSFKTPPPTTFIPFLPCPRNQATSEETKPSPQAQEQKPLPPPPLMPQLQGSVTFATPSKAKISFESKEPEFLLRPRKTRRTMRLSEPLSSPPPLIPSFDYGVSSTTRDAITPPPGASASYSSFMTPLSIMVTKAPLSVASVGTPEKNLVMAKPIARRPLITPSTLPGSSTKDPKNKKPSMLECSPRRLFPSSFRNSNNIINERNGVANSSLLSSMESSAFSFSSSIPPSLLSSTIRRTLSTDEDD